MMIASLIGLVMVSVMSSASVQAADNPALQPYEADYRFFYGSKDVGGSVISLAKAPGSWQLHAETTPEGLAALIKSGTLVEDTQLVLHNGQLRPLYYKSETHGTKFTYRGRVPKVDLEEQITFDWNNNQADYYYEQETKTVAVPDGTVTRQALSLALAFHFAAKGEAVVGETVALQFPDRQKMKEYKFVVKEEVMLSTKAGNFKTYHLERDSGKRITAFWLAPELNFQPVRFEKYKKGETKISSEMTAIRWGNPTPKVASE